MSKRFGKNPNGKVTICRAKPENLGKYNCTHVEHFDVTEKELKEGILHKLNENYFEKENENFSLNKNSIPIQKIDEYSNTINGDYISKEDLQQGAKNLSKNFDKEAFNFIREFYSSIGDDLISFNRKSSRRIADEKITNAISNIQNFLESDNTTAIKMRKFLGKDVNLKDLSEILVLQVGSMTASVSWSGRSGKSSVRRSILTSLNNDMTKERYVASVLFFGGRCCYCNTVLRKGPPPNKQASGEHITPISPAKDGDPIGSTRYGNMALACVACNKERANKELVSFVQSTSRIKKEDKVNVLARIQNFRNFALYEDYNKGYNKKIEEKIKSVSKYEKSFRNPDGSFTEFGIREKIREKIKIAVYDLKEDHF